MPILLVLLLLFAGFTEQRTGLPVRDGGAFVPGEELLYQVSWSGITIGTIRLRALPTRRQGGILVCPAEAFINSKEGLPFVNVHFRASTEMDSGCFSLGFRSLEQDGDIWIEQGYRCEFGRGIVVVEETEHPDVLLSEGQLRRRDTLRLQSNQIQDGISLVYFARRLVRETGKLSIPTLSYGQMGATDFDSSRPRAAIRINAIRTRVRTVGLTGKLRLKGIFGLSGEYRGWFSDDPASIPVKAEMKVLLGSVKVELVSWSHPGWTPPAAE